MDLENTKYRLASSNHRAERNPQKEVPQKFLVLEKLGGSQTLWHSDSQKLNLAVAWPLGTIFTKQAFYVNFFKWIY